MPLRQTLSTGTSESSIIFFNGGHDHNGTSSSLIDTSRYSMYDFTPDFLGTDARREGPQAVNSGKFQEVIAKIVREDVLTVAGITLLPNQVKANNIAAGSVTATALAANIVLVDNIISSNNFDGTVAANGVITSQGTSGWAITSAGSAAFSNTAIRGTLTAGAVSTPGIDIDANGNLTSNASTFGIYANGAIFTSSGNFSVDASGNLYAENATIYGEINATSGSIDGDLISGGTISGVELQIGSNFSVDASGNLYANNAEIFGEINASVGTIGGYSINGTSLYSATISLESGVIQVNQGGDSGFCQLGGGESRFNKVGFQSPSVSGWDTNFYPYTDSSGNLGVNSGGNQNRWNNLNYVGTLNDTSDERTKTSITSLPSMLPLIDSLNPVSYLKKIAYTESMIPLPDNGKRAGARRHFGLIAQEVRSAMNANGFDVNEYSGWGMVDRDDPESEQMLMYLEFIGILLKGVQELSQKVSALENAVQPGAAGVENEV
jgi:hypothetical protein